MGANGHGTMMVVGKNGRWRVRIVVDNGLVVETKQSFATVEEAKAHGNNWCKENGIRTELAQ
jgi:hypothetical protein